MDFLDDHPKLLPLIYPSIFAHGQHRNQENRKSKNSIHNNNVHHDDFFLLFGNNGAHKKGDRVDARIWSRFITTKSSILSGPYDQAQVGVVAVIVLLWLLFVTAAWTLRRPSQRRNTVTNKNGRTMRVGWRKLRRTTQSATLDDEVTDAGSSTENNTNNENNTSNDARLRQQQQKKRRLDLKAHELLKQLMVLQKKQKDSHQSTNNGSNHNSRNNSGPSSLLRSIKYLVEVRPSVLQTCDSNRLYPLHLACLYSAHWTVIQYFVEHDPAQSLQKTATTGNGFEILPLHFASWRNHPAKTIQILIKAYPQALSMHTERGQWLPLHLACRSGPQCSLELVQELVQQHPAALTHGGSASELPLHCACYYQNSFAVIEYLTLKSPEALTAKTREGWTPLTLAAARDLSLDTIYFMARRCPHVLINQTKHFQQQKQSYNYNSGWSSPSCSTGSSDSSSSSSSSSDTSLRQPHRRSREDERTTNDVSLPNSFNPDMQDIS